MFEEVKGMKSLKLVLWICGIGFLTALPFMALPWGAVESVYRWLGEEPIPPVHTAVYVYRIACGMVGLIGIYLIILARNPLRYGPLLVLTGCGAIALGLLCLVVGLTSSMSPLIWFGDAVCGFVAGVLVLVLSWKAFRSQNGAQ